MGLVVKQLSFYSLSLYVGKLTAAGCVAGGDGSRSEEIDGSTETDFQPGLDHNLIDDLWVIFHLKVACLGDAHEAGQHVFPWNTVIIEAKPAVVDTGITNFFANVSDLDAWEWHVGVLVSDRNEEGQHTVVSVFHLAAGEDYGVSAYNAQRARPEFGGSDRGCIDHELVVCLVELRCGLQALHI